MNRREFAKLFGLTAAIASLPPAVRAAVTRGELSGEDAVAAQRDEMPVSSPENLVNHGRLLVGISIMGTYAEYNEQMGVMRIYRRAKIEQLLMQWSTPTHGGFLTWNANHGDAFYFPPGDDPIVRVDAGLAWLLSLRDVETRDTYIMAGNSKTTGAVGAVRITRNYDEF